MLTFTLTIIFADFDECWDAYHALPLEPAAIVAMCEETRSAAPPISIRPVAREDQE